MNNKKINTYQVDFDLNKTKLSCVIDVLCNSGDFAIYDNKYYIYTTLTKQCLINRFKKVILSNEQVFVKSVENLILFEEPTIEKKVTYSEVSDIAIKRVYDLLNDVYTEMQKQVKGKEECDIGE